MFWAVFFPLILGTFFYFSFWSMTGKMGDNEAEWQSIPVAVIDTGDKTEKAVNFGSMLSSVDGGILNITAFDSEDAALAGLADETITGIFYIKETPSLTVSKSGINETILKSLLDAYLKNFEIISNVAKDHPEKLAETIASLSGTSDYISDVDLGGKTMDPNIVYFFALIAYTCLNGAYLGVSSSFKSQANLSALGVRRSITPMTKLRLVLTDLSVLVIIQFVNAMILTLYLIYALKIPIGVGLVPMALTNLVGSIIGVSIGLVLGCTSKAGMGVKTGLCVLITLLPGFLAGLMYGNMIHIIETHAPIVNRINPAAVLADAYYSLSVFDNASRFSRDIIIMLIMSVILLTIALLQLRRDRYDSL